VSGEQLARVGRIEVGDVSAHRDVRRDLGEARLSRDGLRRDLLRVVHVEERLAGEVRLFDDVAIHERQTADTGPRGELRRRRADRADADDRHREPADALLALLADALEEDRPRESLVSDHPAFPACASSSRA
jgi:hypothetical protein